MSKYGSDHENPNYVESIASLKRKTKEDIRIDSIIPSHILEDSINSDGSPNVKTLLEYYYKFMNMEEFIYTSTETYTDLLSASTVHTDKSKAVFRIPDPNNENNQFFADSTGGNSTLIVDNAGTNVTIPLTGNSVPSISNGNELPGTLINSLTPTGKTFTVEDIDGAYVGKYATLTTVAKHWVGPGPSYVLNAIEEAMNIDENSTTYLDMMQKEIAGSIPRDLTSVEKRSLYKNITEFYKLKGAQDSIEIFFRLLFDEPVEIEYPWDATLIPSSGDWDPALNRYLDHKGWLSDKIKLQDSYFYQKFSYNIKTGKNLSDWKYAFDRLVHPAGFIFFGEVLIMIELTRLILGDFIRDSKTTPGDGLVQDPANPGYQYKWKNVYLRSGRKTLSSMPGLQPGVIGAEDVALLVEAFASTFLPNIIAKVDRSATLSTNFSGGQITSIEIINGGWGYPSAPVLTITGDNGSSATATCTIDTDTGVVETVTITNAGSGYTTAYTSAAANPDASKIKTILQSNLSNKRYTTAPTLTFVEPTSVDSDGVPLATNVTATARVHLAAADILYTQAEEDHEQRVYSTAITAGGSGYTSDPTVTFSAPGGGGTTATGTAVRSGAAVASITITNAGTNYSSAPTITFSGGGGSNATATAGLVPEGLRVPILAGEVKTFKGEITEFEMQEDGFGYIVNPRIKIASPTESESRGKDVKEILIIMLNHVADRQVYQTWGEGFKTLSENDYFESKNTYYANKKFRDNYPISFFSENIIGSTYESVINKYNVKTNIAQE